MKAESLLSSGRNMDLATQLMDDALALSTSTPTLVTLVILCIQFGVQKVASPLIKLKQKVNTHGRAYAKMAAGVEYHLSGDLGQATNEINEALETADLWILRYSLALIYVDAGLSLEARDQLEICANRQGEALSAALDEQPTFRYLTRSSGIPR